MPSRDLPYAVIMGSEGACEDRAGVVTVGSVHMDLVATADRLPVRGETLPGRSFAMHPGGKGGNQATQAARAGVRSWMIARLGTDDFGDRLHDALAGAGVDTAYIVRDPDAATGVSSVLVGEGGDYASMIVPGAAMLLTRANLDAARPVWEQARVLLLQCEIPLDVSALAAGIAQEHGMTVIFSAAPAPANLAALPVGMLANVDMLIVNSVEAGMLTGHDVRSTTDAESAGNELLATLGHDGAVVVTLGGDGALLCREGSTTHQRGHVVEVAGTLGGGDAFTGMLAAEIARGSSLGAALPIANAAGALAVTRPGAHDALPTRRDVLAFLGEYDRPAAERFRVE